MTKRIGVEIALPIKERLGERTINTLIYTRGNRRDTWELIEAVTKSECSLGGVILATGQALRFMTSAQG